MKRTAIIVIALGLALSACSSGKAVGSGDLVDIDETNRVSPTATATKTESKKPTAKAKPTKSEAPKQDLCPPGGEIEVRIRTLGDGFEWRIKGTKNDFGPTPFRVLQGCEVLFRNDDPDRKHSWYSGDNGPDAGKAWKSPALSKGQTWVMDTTKIPAGFYSCHDGEVPYIVCSAEIVARQ